MRRILFGLIVSLSTILAARADTPPAPGWTDAEAWAWGEIAAGRSADFAARCQSEAAPGSGANWTGRCREMRGTVLEQMLTRPPWRDEIQHRGLWINGAHLRGGLDLANAHIASALILTRSHIDGDVVLARARFDSLLALDGSVVAGKVWAAALLSDGDVSLSDGRQLTQGGDAIGDFEALGTVTLRGARIKGSVFLNAGLFHETMDLRGAHIDGDLQTSGAEFDETLPAGAMQIGGKLSINATRFKKNIVLPDSTIAGLVDASDSIVAGTLNLVDSYVAGDVFMNKIEAVKGIDISGLRVGGYLRLSGSTVKGPLKAVNAQIAGDLGFDSAGHFETLVSLAGMRLGGSLIMSGAPFAAAVSLRGMHVAGNLRLEGARFDKTLDMLGLHADGDLILTGAIVTGNLDASDMAVGHDLALNENAHFGGKVNLFDAHVTNSLHMERSMFDDLVFGASLHVTGDMLLQEAKFAGPVVLNDARIGGSLVLAGAYIGALDLTGASIDGSLEVSSKTTWRRPLEAGAAQLLLVNARVGGLQDDVVGKLEACPTDSNPPTAFNGWPAERTIELDGFSYAHLGSSAGSAGSDMRNRDVCWWRWWLERDRRFSTQPYVQLAAVMAAHGDPDNAATILYYGRIRETRLAYETGHYVRWTLLTALNVITGYGIGTYTFRALGWIVALMALGVFMLRWAPGGGQKPLLWKMGASLARVLPGVEINKEFSDFFDDPQRQRLRDWQVFAFSAFVVIGWVLGLFLVAAMSGLTQHS